MKNFLHYWGISQLKTLLRQGWVNKVPFSNIESVADHSFAVGYFAFIFAHWENECRLNVGKPVLQKSPSEYCVMGLMHDIAEGFYADFDKNVTTLLPELESIKPLAEKRGFEQMHTYWSQRIHSLNQVINAYFIEYLNPEDKSFIKIVDKIEFHWQAITYFLQNWISKVNAKEFIEESFKKIILAKKEFYFAKELEKNGLLIQNIEDLHH